MRESASPAEPAFFASSALQLRNWAVRPEDAMLPLEEIALRILDQEENRNAKAARQR